MSTITELTPFGTYTGTTGDFNALRIFFPTSVAPLPDDGAKQRVANAKNILAAVAQAASLQQANAAAQLAQVNLSDPTAISLSQATLVKYFEAGRVLAAVPVYETTLDNWLANHDIYRGLVAVGKLTDAPPFPEPTADLAAYLPGLQF
jgi:hypothetical protein